MGYAQQVQIGDDRRRIGKGKITVELESVGCARPRRRLHGESSLR